MASAFSDKALADSALVQAAMDEWRLRNEPTDYDGLTMAEAVVIALYARGRLA